MVSNELHFPNWVRKPGYGTKRICPSYGWNVIRCLLLVIGIGCLTVTGVASATEQGTDSGSAQDVEVKSTQQDAAADQVISPADTIRDQITALGYHIDDTAAGPVARKG